MCILYLDINLLILQNSEDESLDKLLSSGYKLLDVRTPAEHANNSAKVAMNVPLANIEEYVDKLDKYVCMYVHYICRCICTLEPHACMDL